MRLRVGGAVAVFVFFLSQSLFATVQRTFVSHSGLDTNPCAVDAPCRTFAAALTQTTAGGEVVVVDSAGYGPVTIAQSVSIVAAAGVYAGISVFSGDGIHVAAATTDVVSLRNLSLNYLGGTGNGIGVYNAGRVEIDHCRVTGGFQYGIVVIPPATANIGVVVSDSVIRGSSSIGLRAYDYTVLSVVRTRFENMLGVGSVIGLDVSGNQAAYTVSDSEFTFNAIGIYVESGTVQVTNCRLHRNTLGIIVAQGMLSVEESAFTANQTAIYLFGNSGSVVSISRSDLISNSEYGIRADDLSATVTLSSCNCVANLVCFENAGTGRLMHNNISSNTTGINNSGTMETLGDNVLRGNGTDAIGSAMVTMIPK